MGGAASYRFHVGGAGQCYTAGRRSGQTVYRDLQRSGQAFALLEKGKALVQQASQAAAISGDLAIVCPALGASHSEGCSGRAAYPLIPRIWRRARHVVVEGPGGLGGRVSVRGRKAG